MNLIQYLEPKKRVLDFSRCKYLGEIHQTIQEELELPEWYGQNLDAFWDSITGIMYLPVDITIIYKPKTNRCEELTREIDKIIDILNRAIDEYGEITLQIDM
ncbi:MAG: barstar family protein [Oscillospiraceae bacterium]|jgi:ribonuclease inhibitor|nr:barstar family protein [Oscillospiraceae bacterium]